MDSGPLEPWGGSKLEAPGRSIWASASSRLVVVVAAKGLWTPAPSQSWGLLLLHKFWDFCAFRVLGYSSGFESFACLGCEFLVFVVCQTLVFQGFGFTRQQENKTTTGQEQATRKGNMTTTGKERQQDSDRTGNAIRKEDRKSIRKTTGQES